MDSLRSPEDFLCAFPVEMKLGAHPHTHQAHPSTFYCILIRSLPQEPRVPGLGETHRLRHHPCGSTFMVNVASAKLGQLALRGYPASEFDMLGRNHSGIRPNPRKSISGQPAIKTMFATKYVFIISQHAQRCSAVVEYCLKDFEFLKT